MVATMLLLCLLPVIGIICKITVTCQGVTIIKMHIDCAPPCVCFFYLNLIHDNTVQMYAYFIINIIESTFASTTPYGYMPNNH